MERNTDGYPQEIELMDKHGNIVVLKIAKNSFISNRIGDVDHLLPLYFITPIIIDDNKKH